MHVTHKVIKRSQVVRYQWTSQKMSLFIQVPLICRFIQHKIWYMVFSRYGSPFLSAISSTHFEALAKRTRKSTQVCKTKTCVRTWWQKRIRMSARKFTQVAKCRTFHAYTDELWSTCVDLRTSLSSIKVHASPRTQPTNQRTVSWTHIKNLHRLVSTCESFWPGLNKPKIQAAKDYFK